MRVKNSRVLYARYKYIRWVTLHTCATSNRELFSEVD